MGCRGRYLDTKLGHLPVQVFRHFFPLQTQLVGQMSVLISQIFGTELADFPVVDVVLLVPPLGGLIVLQGELFLGQIGHQLHDLGHVQLGLGQLVLGDLAMSFSLLLYTRRVNGSANKIKLK